MGRAPAPVSLRDAVDAADAKVTALDEKVDVENDAIFHWLKGHRIWTHVGEGALVMEPGLPQPWRDLALRFKSKEDALKHLQGLRIDAKSAAAIRKVLGPPKPRADADSAAARTPLAAAAAKTAPPTTAETLQELAALIAAGSAWIVPIRRIPSRFIGKTDPAVFTRVNTALGTNVNFTFLGQYEGGQWLRGYVPIRRASGLVVGKSGMTIGTGFDIGQWHASDLTGALGLTTTIADKLKYFTARDAKHSKIARPAAPGETQATAVEPTGNFKAMNKAAVAKRVADTAPVPELSKAEADAVDEATHQQILAGVKAKWNASAVAPVPRFEKLPAGWQTVLMSRTFQQGAGFSSSAPGKTFFDQAVKGDWTTALATFVDYPNHGSFSLYRERLVAEAALLSADMPAPIPKAPAKPAAASAH